jgi:hypothetical protein
MKRLTPNIGTSDLKQHKSWGRRGLVQFKTTVLLPGAEIMRNLQVKSMLHNTAIEDMLRVTDRNKTFRELNILNHNGNYMYHLLHD